MTWAGFVRRNLLRRPVRTLLTSLGVALGVALIVALLSITAGVQQTASQLIHVGRADFGLFQRGISDLTLSRLPQNLVGEVARRPGVAAAAPIFLESTSSLLVFGLEPGTFPDERLVILAGRRPHGDEALLGRRAAQKLGLGPGGQLRIGKRAFGIAGVYASGNSFEDAGAVLPLTVVEKLAGRPGTVTTVAVTVSLGDDPRAVAHQLEDRFPGTLAVVEPGQAVKIDTSTRLIVDAGWIVSVLALIVGSVAVTNSMAMSVFERTHEIGILRAVGWPRRRVAALIASEALGIALLSLSLGTGLGIAAAELFTSRGEVSTLIAPAFDASVFAWGIAFALGVALLGALYPTWRAMRLMPIDALRRQ